MSPPAPPHLSRSIDPTRIPGGLSPARRRSTDPGSIGPDDSLGPASHHGPHSLLDCRGLFAAVDIVWSGRKPAQRMSTPTETVEPGAGRLTQSRKAFEHLVQPALTGLPRWRVVCWFPILLLLI